MGKGVGKIRKREKRRGSGRKNIGKGEGGKLR
jgi:hypothetical protein